MKRYKTITVSRRVKLLAIHFVHNNVADITCKVRKRRKPKKTIKPGTLTFLEFGNVVAWGNDSQSFRPITFRLIHKLWFAKDNFLSKEDIREYIMQDEDARSNTMRVHVFNARQGMESVGVPYQIITIRGEGYRLVARF